MVLLIAVVAIVLSTFSAVAGQRWSVDHRYTGTTVRLHGVPADGPADHRQEDGRSLILQIDCNASGWQNRSGSALLTVAVDLPGGLAGGDVVAASSDVAESFRLPGELFSSGSFLDPLGLQPLVDALRSRDVLDLAVQLRRGWVVYRFDLAASRPPLGLIARCLDAPIWGRRVLVR